MTGGQRFCYLCDWSDRWYDQFYDQFLTSFENRGGQYCTCGPISDQF
nr:MAG TPA: hypothetical protein [Caudoviricetes sp.]